MYYRGAKMATRQIINISMPPKMAQDIKKQAVAENRSVSELLKEAYRQYKLDQEWLKIRRWGERVAQKFNLKTEEDVERIAG